MFPRINYDKLCILSERIDWNLLTLENNPDVAMNKLIEIIQDLIKESYSVPNKRSKTKYGPRKDWITKGILTSCKRKEVLYLTWKKNKSSMMLKSEYNKYCKVLNKVIKFAKQNYLKSQVSKYKDDSTKLWNFIKLKLGKNSDKKDNIEFILNAGVKIEDKREISDHFVDYFSDIGNKLASDIDKSIKYGGKFGKTKCACLKRSCYRNLC